MIIFFGTSPRSALFLNQAIQNGLEVNLVVSAPPKPVGKKQILTENPTVALAKKINIPFETNLDVDVIAIPSLSREKQSRSDDIGIILDFNQIIPNEIINLFPKGIINIHFSKLPQYRGPAPVQYTILNGDKEAWITYYLITEKLDAGQILMQTSLPLDMTETTESLYQKLIAKSADEIQKIIDNYLRDRYHTCQQEGTPTITHKLTAENCKIDWQKSPEEIDRLIRAAYPEPGAWSLLNLHSKNSPPSSRACRGIPFFPAEERDSSMRDAPYGASLSRNDKVHRLKILKARLEQGKLIIDQVQLEGKTPVSWKQFQQGYPQVAFL